MKSRSGCRSREALNAGLYKGSASRSGAREVFYRRTSCEMRALTGSTFKIPKKAENMSYLTSKPSRRSKRRGAVLVLAAVLFMVMLAMVAFAIDIGYLSLVRTQLQAAADAAALAGAASTNLSLAESRATAQDIAARNIAGGRPVLLNDSDIEFGVWDVETRTFTPSQSWNAVRVTARHDATSGGPTQLFFGPLLGVAAVNQQASAVATVNPRDIAFVVDLSGSMNDDTDPDNTASLNSRYAADGYPTIGTDLMQQVYDDFGFGTYPGTSQWAGQPLGIPSSSDWVNRLTKSGGPLRNSSIPVRYRVLSNDSSSTRTWKAYAWVMEVQIHGSLMPNATPVPNADVNYNYWKTYIDQYYSQLGYRSYMKFMMYNGRERKPDGSTYTPLSLNSGITPMHAETTDGGTFMFPPREQPTHAARRAIIAAIQVVSQHNQMISNPNQRDWVSIITFDKNSVSPPSPRIEQSLTSDYQAAMEACTRLQACSDSTSNTCTEAGLILARNHIKPQSQGGAGRERTNKIVVLLTDGMPNLYQSSTTTINNYVAANPNPNFYTTTSYPRQAALMQTHMMQGDNWYVYPVGVGLGTDYDFMDRVARMSGTANAKGQSPRGTGNPGEYEDVLRNIFEQIITRPKLRLVQ